MSKFEQIDVQLKNGKTVCIREAVTKDAEALIVAAKSYLRTSEYLCSYDDEFTPSKKEQTGWVKAHDNVNSLLLIATYDKEIIATLNAAGFPNRKMRHVAALGISILKEWRGVGLGNVLFECMIAWARDKSPLAILTLDVFSANEPAIKLYEKYGFVKEGERKNYFKNKAGEYCNDVIMSLHLREKLLSI